MGHRHLAGSKGHFPLTPEPKPKHTKEGQFPPSAPVQTGSPRISFIFMMTAMSCSVHLGLQSAFTSFYLLITAP